MAKLRSGSVGKEFKLELQLVRLVTPEQHGDRRGSFTRLVDTLWGVPPILQVSVSQNTAVGTMRGMHSSVRSSGEFKVVTCIEGAISDFVIDLRPESPDYMVVKSFELKASKPTSILIPPGCAHGYVTREVNTRVLYSMTSLYNPDTEVGYMWNDPMLGIEWPIVPNVISDRDQAFELLTQKPTL